MSRGRQAQRLINTGLVNENSAARGTGHKPPETLRSLLLRDAIEMFVAAQEEVRARRGRGSVDLVV